VSADPFVKLGLDRLVVVAVVAPAVSEEGLDAVKETLLPLTDLDGMDLEGLGEFGGGPVLLAASKVTLALNEAECRLRGPVMTHLGMDRYPSISSTSRAPQEMGSISPLAPTETASRPTFPEIIHGRDVPTSRQPQGLRSFAQ
jgi:hypothetical protein